MWNTAMLPTIKVVILFVTLTVHGMVMEYTRNSLVLQKVITHELNIYGVQFWIWLGEL